MMGQGVLESVLLIAYGSRQDNNPLHGRDSKSHHKTHQLPEVAECQSWLEYFIQFVMADT